MVVVGPHRGHDLQNRGLRIRSPRFFVPFNRGTAAGCKTGTIFFWIGGRPVLSISSTDIHTWMYAPQLHVLRSQVQVRLYQSHSTDTSILLPVDALNVVSQSRHLLSTTTSLPIHRVQSRNQGSIVASI